MIRWIKGRKDSNLLPLGVVPIVYQQIQATQSESKMEKSSGKIPRPPIKCWGCKGTCTYIVLIRETK
jgi:hypothetical protein